MSMMMSPHRPSGEGMQASRHMPVQRDRFARPFATGKASKKQLICSEI